MKNVKHQEILEFTYASEEERKAHVELMLSEGWQVSGQVQRLKEGVSVWNSNNDEDYEWFAIFWTFH